MNCEGHKDTLTQRKKTMAVKKKGKQTKTEQTITEEGAEANDCADGVVLWVGGSIPGSGRTRASEGNTCKGPGVRAKR
jgi:hypothetical protein